MIQVGRTPLRSRAVLRRACRQCGYPRDHSSRVCEGKAFWLRMLSAGRCQKKHDHSNRADNRTCDRHPPGRHRRILGISEPTYLVVPAAESLTEDGQQWAQNNKSAAGVTSRSPFRPQNRCRPSRVRQSLCLALQPLPTPCKGRIWHGHVGGSAALLVVPGQRCAGGEAPIGHIGRGATAD